MKTRVGCLLALLTMAAMPAWGRARTWGYCQKGNVPATTMGYVSTNSLQGSYPSCTVTVYAAGTSNLATLYSDNSSTPTVRANPFTADTTGYWYFYADDGKYDVQMGGSLPGPATLGDMSVFDSFTNYSYIGSVSRSVSSKLGDLLSIKDFGCAGDGVTDDTACIQAATAAAIANRKGNYCPAGFYKTTGLIQITLPTPLYANGGSPPYSWIGDGACTIQVASTDGSGGMEIRIPPNNGAYEDGTTFTGTRFLRDPVATGNPAFALKLTTLAQFQIDNIRIFTPPVNVANAFAIGLWLNGSQEGEVHGSQFAYSTIGVSQTTGTGTGVPVVGGPTEFHGNMLIGSSGQTCYQINNGVDAYIEFNNFGSCDTGINNIGANGYIVGNHFELHATNAYVQSGTNPSTVFQFNQVYQGATRPGLLISTGVANISNNRIDGSVTFASGACSDITLPACIFNFNKNTYNPVDNTGGGKLTMFGNQPTGLSGTPITTPTLLTQPMQLTNMSSSTTSVNPMLVISSNPNIAQDVYMTMPASGASGNSGISMGTAGSPGIVANTTKSFLDIDSAVGTAAGSEGTTWARFAASMSYLHTSVTADAGYVTLGAAAGGNYLTFNYLPLSASLIATTKAGFYMGDSLDGANRFTLMRYPVGGPATMALASDSHNFIQPPTITYSGLLAPDSNNAAWIYCTDCTIATPCTGAGTGAFAFYSKATLQWKCPF